MPVIKSQGSLRHVVRSWRALSWTSIKVVFRHLIGRPLDPEWSISAETGNLFWRGQFNYAFALADINEGRDYFDSLLTETDEVYAVDRLPTGADEPRGHWVQPHKKLRETTLLYLHGGGYTFYPEVSKRMGDMMADKFGMEVFVLDYRLTPENPHPAQIEDALEAYTYLLAKGKEPNQIVLAGDSAGGHLVLMLLIALREKGLPQPALAIGFCPWTDVGGRGASLFGHNKYDNVQGYMALQFGEWLKGEGGFTNEELSPIHQDYKELAPLYLQAGGREILLDMIRDFAKVVHAQGVDVTLDVWEPMTHVFQANGSTLPESKEALERVIGAIEIYTSPNSDDQALKACPRTEIGGDFLAP